MTTGPPVDGDPKRVCCTVLCAGCRALTPRVTTGLSADRGDGCGRAADHGRGLAEIEAATTQERYPIAERGAA